MKSIGFAAIAHGYGMDIGSRALILNSQFVAEFQKFIAFSVENWVAQALQKWNYAFNDTEIIRLIPRIDFNSFHSFGHFQLRLFWECKRYSSNGMCEVII